jgi:ABC-type transport system involved in multi-copper enzyme maturation permease subunit
MTGPHFVAVVSAEIRKLFSRSSARFGVLFAVLLGLGVPLTAGFFRWIAEQAMDKPGQLQAIDPSFVVYATLYIRNFFLMRIILIMVGALSLAGEYQSRTLREDVLRPVHRSVLLFAKWLALDVFILVTLVMTVAPATALSMVAWGTDGDWKHVMLGWLATLACDAGFAALVLALAAILRSVAGTMVGMFLFYFANVALGWALLIVANLPFLQLPDWAREALANVGPYLPPAAYDAWTGASPYSEFVGTGFGALAVYSVLSYILADRVFARIDVP